MGTSQETQSITGEFVNKNVYSNQTSLVDALLGSEDKELYNAGMSYDGLSNSFYFYCAECGEELEEGQLIQGEFCPYCEEKRGESVICERLDKEILEWWIVSDFLLEKLRTKGEPILDTDFGSWWGRTCSGQAILLDSVIEDICKDIGLL